MALMAHMYAKRQKEDVTYCESIFGHCFSMLNDVMWYGFWRDDNAGLQFVAGYKTIRYAPNSAFNSCHNVVGIQRSTEGNQSLKIDHTGGVHVLVGDGSVRFLSDNIDLATFYNLADRADGKAIGQF